MTGQHSEVSTPTDGKSAVIIGASPNRRSYGNKSVRAHLAQGWQVYPVHPTATEVEGLQAWPSIDEVPLAKVQRVSMYVRPEIGIQLLESIARKQPEEVWLNPGTANDALIQQAETLGLPVIQACSIVDLGTSPAAYPG